jgi:hypothetical protein
MTDKERITELEETLEKFRGYMTDIRITELEETLEKFRGYMTDIAVDYLENCPEGYMKFANKKMEEVKDEV